LEEIEEAVMPELKVLVFRALANFDHSVAYFKN